MPTQQYNQDQLWKVFETLPEELKQAVFSAENADHTLSICEKYDIEECSQLASIVGLVLMGVMLPSDFEEALQKNLGLDQETAQRIAQEINRFVFYPVKAQLEQIHQVPGETGQQQEGKNLGVPTPRHSDRVAAPQKTEAQNDYMIQEEPNEKRKEKRETFTEEQGKQDSYREPIE